MLPHPRHRAPRRHYALAVFELVCIVLAWTGFALVACALFLPGR